MLDRRTCSPWLATLLTGAVCLSVWQMIGCPGPPLPVFLPGPVYVVLTPSNATLDPPYSTHLLPDNDYTNLIDLNDFKFSMLGSKMTCNDTSGILLLVLVHSAPGNTAKRQTIRNTWGESREAMKLVFMVGKNRDFGLERENDLYGDLVQGNFVDAYRNMTYKHVMALKFAAYHCPQAKYVLKTDDDVFVNMPTVMAFLNVELSPWGARRLLLCRPLFNSFVKRSYRSKWRVSYREYAGVHYPPYCPGYAILYSPDVVFALYREAQKASYFWIDDVLITGILAERAKFVHTPILELVLTNEAVDELIRTNGTHGAPNMFLYGPPDMKLDTIHALWNVVRIPRSNHLK